MSLSPAELLAHTTVRIECQLSGGLGTGTGFFYSLNRETNQHVPVIVTNKHVVDGAAKGRFILTLQNSIGEPDVGMNHGFELDNFQSFWRPHPDPSVDLCAMPIAPLVKVVELLSKKPFYATFDKSLIPAAADIDDMMGMEEIIMVGYPDGLWDSVNNLPIFRRGILASDYARNWNGKKEFLIDAACFPGSSGSPIMLFDIGSYRSRKGTHLASSRIKLLGILYGGPQYTAEGDIEIVSVPTVQKAVSITKIPNNLGVAIKSERLLDFEGLFK
jgi:hypothetical protein